MSLPNQPVSAGELDLGRGPLCGGWGSRGAAELPVVSLPNHGTGSGDAGAGSGVGPFEGRVGRCRRRLRHVAVLPRRVGNLGNALRLGRSGRLYGVAGGARVDHSGLPGTGWPSQAQAGGRAAAHHGAAGCCHPRGCLAGDNGGPGESGAPDLPVQRPAATATKRRKPGEEVWAVCRRNLDGSEPRYYLSNATEDTPLETLAYVGGSRWRIETEFETEKGDVGMDEYETRTWAGWHHHVALCLVAGAFLLSLQQAWGEKDAPDHPSPGLQGSAGYAAPGTGSGRMNC